jgi:hypothetical protein
VAYLVGDVQGEHGGPGHDPASTVTGSGGLAQLTTAGATVTPARSPLMTATALGRVNRNWVQESRMPMLARAPGKSSRPDSRKYQACDGSISV